MICFDNNVLACGVFCRQPEHHPRIRRRKRSGLWPFIPTRKRTHSPAVAKAMRRPCKASFPQHRPQLQQASGLQREERGSPIELHWEDSFWNITRLVLYTQYFVYAYKKHLLLSSIINNMCRCVLLLLYDMKTKSSY